MTNAPRPGKIISDMARRDVLGFGRIVSEAHDAEVRENALANRRFAAWKRKNGR